MKYRIPPFNHPHEPWSTQNHLCKHIGHIMKKFIFTMRVPPKECLLYYQGEINRIVVNAHNGQKLSIPASRFRKFITKHGIQGEFEIQVDENHRFISIEPYRPDSRLEHQK